MINRLKDKKVLINYDSDPPGKANSRKLTEKFGYSHVNVPDNLWPIKDFADMIKEYGTETVKNYLKSKGIPVK